MPPGVWCRRPAAHLDAYCGARKDITISYSYPIDARAMFEDRTHQFVGFGLPAGDVERVRAATTGFWADAPGGWPYEFSRLAAAYTVDHKFLLASLAYGCAKFPCLADEARRTAQTHQLEQYQPGHHGPRYR